MFTGPLIDGLSWAKSSGSDDSRESVDLRYHPQGLPSATFNVTGHSEAERRADDCTVSTSHCLRKLHLRIPCRVHRGMRSCMLGQWPERRHT
jgi:hypothetical protein